DLLKEHLRILGHTMASAYEFRDVLSWDASRLGAFDVAIIDKQINDEDGLELGPELRKRAETIQLVMLTGYGTIDYAVRAIKDGFTDFIQKPDLSRLEEILVNIQSDCDVRAKLRSVGSVEVGGQLLVGAAPAFRQALDLAIRAGRKE